MGMSASQARLLSLTSRMSDTELIAQQISNARLRLAGQSEELALMYTQALNSASTAKVNQGSSIATSTKYNVKVNANNLIGPSMSTGSQYILLDVKDGSNKVIVSKDFEEKYKLAGGNLNSFLSSQQGLDPTQIRYYTNLFNEISKTGGLKSESEDNLSSSEWLQENLSKNQVYLKKYDNTTGGFTGDDWQKDTAVSDSMTYRIQSSIAEKEDEKKDVNLSKATSEYEAKMTVIHSQDRKFELELKQIETEHQTLQTEFDSVKKVCDKNIDASFKTFG